jgi:hypothetical protein
MKLRYYADNPSDGEGGTVPKKLQIKLLSDAGELLNVVTCCSGQISVFRAHAAADLRPYQRALAGVPTKERFVVALDGNEYTTSQVSLIGFGEGGLSSNQSTREYLLESGCSVEAVDGLLLSFGLERYSDTACSSLPADEERRVRILAACLQPQKALIINEPFEPIASQWRERAADILSSSARSQNALIVIPSLSFRPEGWIDNPCIARMQVGQTLQKTIGFGAAGSSANEMMEAIKQQVRAEQAVAESASQAQPLETQLTSSQHEEVDLTEVRHAERLKLLAPILNRLGLSPLARRGGYALAAGAVAAMLLLVMGGSLLLASSPTSELQGVAVAHNAPPPPISAQDSALKGQAVSLPLPPRDGDNAAASVTQPTEQALPAVAQEQKRVYVLDGYPSHIKESLLATVRGVPSDIESSDNLVPAVQHASTNAQQNGNIFKLLEHASSSDAPSAGDGGYPYASSEESAPDTAWSNNNQEPQEEGDWEAKREAIREKFLEAIRAAADRRENELGEE